MAEESKITQADIDKAVKAALDAAKEEFDAKLETETSGVKAKNAELLTELKEARKGRTIDPAEIEKLEARIEDLTGKLTAAEKLAKDADKLREKAEKALEAESGAARNYARDAEISGAIAEGNVAPALVPYFTAALREQAKTELVNGKYTVTIGDVDAREHVKAVLESEDGKHLRVAMVNTGGGAGGGGGSGGGKSMPKSQFDGLTAKDKAAKMAEGFTLVDG